ETWNRGRGAFDLVASVGSPARLSSIASLVRPGGLVLYGDGYWRREPSQEYLEALGAARGELEDYAGTIRRATELALTPLYALSPPVPRLIAEAANPMGATASASQCVRLRGVNAGPIVSADGSPPEADVRIAADRHKYPLRWRAFGMDIESQAASALL